jgi:transposase InsO family protein
VRGPAAERRSFLAEHADDLWVGDAMHPLAPDGKLRKVIVFSQIDNATRFVLHSYLAIVDGEDAATQERGLKQAILKYGLPRAYYVDRGPAYIAHSLRDICAELDIHLQHAGAGDAEAKGVIECWHRTWRGEIEDELGDAPPAAGRPGRQALGLARQRVPRAQARDHRAHPARSPGG